MTLDLKERFALADEVGPSDVWEEAQRRAASPEVSSRARDERWSPGWRRVGTGVVAFAVFTAAVVFAWDLSHPQVDPPPAHVVDLAAELPAGWTELPAPPQVRSDAAKVWTGSQLLIWGGYEFTEYGEGPLPDGGLYYDAASRRWSTIPQGPLSKRAEPASAWTGREFLIWGGWDGGFRDEPTFDDGAAFDPVARSWRLLPPAPISARRPFSVWTGRELIAWGSRDWSDPMRDGAAYDPSTNSWRLIPAAPLDINDGSAVWTGDEMIVFGAWRRGGAPDTETAVGAAYDPELDRWRVLPASTLSPNATTASWVGDELVAWDYELASASYDARADVWRRLPRVPLSFVECVPQSVATTGAVFGDYCGRTVVFATSEGAWHREPLPIPRGGCCRLNETVAAGDAVLVLSHATDSESLDATDRLMFAYNPPAIVRTDPRGEVLEPEPFVPGTERDGNRILMPVTFPDGSSAIVSYPIPLDLATMGVGPDVSYTWKEFPAPRFNIAFLHDANASIARYVRDTAPVDRIVRGETEIEIWRARGDDPNTSFWLRYRLLSWTILAPVWNIDGAVEDVAASLDVIETPDGFPVVVPSGPLDLADGYGEAEGAILSIGSFGDPQALDAMVDLSPDGCSTPDVLSPSHETATMCLADGNVFVNIDGDPPLVEDVFASLGVDDFASVLREVEPTPFVPEVFVSDGVARVPVTFPDGASATLVYPVGLGLAQHGIQPDNTYDSERTGLVPIMFIHGPPGVEHDYVVGAAPELLIAGPVGPAIGLWRATRLGESSIDPIYWLLHRRGGWTILVGVPSKAIAQDVADFLVPHVDPSTGMPWVEARNGFELSPFAGEGGGTNLTIGDLEPSPRSIRFAEHDFPFIEIRYSDCREGVTDASADGEYASLCTGGGRISVDLAGSSSIVRELLEGIRVEDFRPA